MRVAIVSTHPIQYHTPWFRELAAKQQVDLKVYYALLPDEQQQGVGFGEAFAWDIPLLAGYDWELIPNKRKSPSLRGFFQSSTPAIYSMLARAKPDAVIITGWQSLPLLQALWACIRLGIPRIVRGESNALRPRPLLVRGLHRLLLSRFDAYLAIGKLNRQFYLEYGIPDERVFSAPYFVDNQRFTDQFRQDVRDRADLRARWNIDDGRPTTRDRRRVCFLFAGKLEPKKRVMDLLNAMEAACGTDGRRTTGRPSIHLLVVGTGELMEEARQFAESRSLPVTFAGFLNQTEITRAYAAADCLVLPSDHGETWGLVVNEAMACGLPAIVSDRVGCGPDLIEEGVTGGVFRCGDINALALKLQSFAFDPERLAGMGEQASRRIKDYSVEHSVDGTMEAISFVTSDRRSVAHDGGPATNNGRPVPAARRSATGDGRPVYRHLSPVSPSLRVLHVIPSLSPKDGGPSFAMPMIARGLERAGVQVDVAATEGDNEQRFEQSGDNVFYFQRQSEFYKVSIPLSRWLSAHIRDYDLVHIHALFSYASYAAARLARKNGVPYIVRPLGVLNRWGMLNRRRMLKQLSFRFIEQRIIRNAAAIHYTSQQERIEAEQTGVRNESVVIPLAVDLAGLRELPGPVRFFEKFPHARGKNIILFLSRLDQKKGLDLLLRAFAMDDRRRETTDDRRETTDDRRETTDDRRETTDDRRETTDDRRETTDDRRPKTGTGPRSFVAGHPSSVAGHPSSVAGQPSFPVAGHPSFPVAGHPSFPVAAHPSSPVGGRPLLVIAGDGDDQFVAGLRSLAEGLGIADEILWTGFLSGDDKLSALAAASLFVLPSYSENFGIALVEAMAAGLPCVMSDQVGIADDAKEYDAGAVVPCEVDPLASAIRRLLDDAELRGRMGANARRLVDERFSIEAMSDSLLKLYDRVLSRADRGPMTADRGPVRATADR